MSTSSEALWARHLPSEGSLDQHVSCHKVKRHIRCEVTPVEGDSGGLCFNHGSEQATIKTGSDYFTIPPLQEWESFPKALQTPAHTMPQFPLFQWGRLVSCLPPKRLQEITGIRAYWGNSGLHIMFSSGHPGSFGSAFETPVKSEIPDTYQS